MNRFPDGFFDISSLDRLEAANGINIFKELALSSKCRPISIAQTIQLDPKASEKTVSRYKQKEACNRALFGAWVHRKSSLAPTWTNLLKVLRTMNIQASVEHIREFFRWVPLVERKKRPEEAKYPQDLVKGQLLTKPQLGEVSIGKIPGKVHWSIQ